MKTRLFCVVIFGIILGICNAAPHDSQEEKARKYADEASKTIIHFYDELANNTLGLETEDITTFFNAIDTLLTKSEVMLSIIRNASKFAETKYKDEELNVIFDKLKKFGDEAILGPDKFLAILLAVGNLEELAADKDIAGYKNKDIELSYFPDIQDIYVKSKDPEELKYYWNAWREKNTKWAVGNFMVMVEGIQEAAKLTGISALEFWMEDFNMTQMDEVMTQIEPIYKQLHGFLRNQLNKKYGDDVVNTKGLIPDHLYTQLLAQAWTNDSVIEEYFPRKELPHFDELLVKNNFDTLNIFKMADKFYESMGFTAIPDNYWGKRLKMKSAEDEGDCKATILAQTPNVYMQYCHKMDFRTFLQAHGYMAEIHFALEKPYLPAYFLDSYNLEYAVGEAVILSASSPTHLKEIGIIPEPVFSEEVFMNRLMRLGIHTMLNIPEYYVLTKMMANLLDGKVEMTELNKHYWELMDKYVGVGPPNDRVHNTFDFPVKFYLELNENLQARKFQSEILGYQIYMKLCSIAGLYPKGKLQNCDLHGSKVAGDALKKMIKLGSSKPLVEVLETLLPESPRLNAEGLLEYYFPAFSWLTVSNRQNNVNIGWTHNDKKIESVTLPKDDE